MGSVMDREVVCRKKGKGEREESAMEGRKGEEGKKRFERRLVKYEALPEYLKDNEFILDYYRAEWPLKEAILSVFSWHNETLNIWTYLSSPTFPLSLSTDFFLRSFNFVHVGIVAIDHSAYP